MIMFSAERKHAIVSLLNRRGMASVGDLASTLNVSEVTVRRDLRELESLNLIQRTHGGAISIQNGIGEAVAATATTFDPMAVERAAAPDALVLAPVQHRVAHALRERALRSGIPLIAESAPIAGAIYLGPRNYEAASSLGRWSGEYAREHMKGAANVLDVTLDLPNTRARSQGFADGLRAVLGENARIVTINGYGLYGRAYQVARDALNLFPEVNVIFGINDDSVLGALQAYQDLGRDTRNLLAVNVGGEGKTLFDVLARRGPLKGCIALFPEVVGWLAVDTALRLWAGDEVGSEVITPSALITADNLSTYYQEGPEGWRIDMEAVGELEQTRWRGSVPRAHDKSLSFVIHYRTHEWYQNVARAMRAYGEAMGVTVSTVDVKEGFEGEIHELRRMIGKMAASYVKDGETIILDSGSYTDSMAHFLDGHRDLTVVTNSIAVFQRLRNHPNIQLMLTGGEFHKDAQALVGRGAQLLIREIRADKVFLVAGGLSFPFGISCETPAEAEVRREMLKAAREVVLLADHTVLGHDARVRVADLSYKETLITDAGATPEQRLAFHQRGIRIMVAGQPLAGDEAKIAWREGGENPS
jgi:DeoR/GlpR family transcriptional regulator of sugar metabolism/ABC-type sugar transport system substrate-binding protein